MSVRDASWWWSALAAWSARPYTTPAYGAWHREGRIQAAADFIHRHHAQATAHGWQPAHLLSERGLAKRWADFACAPPRIGWAQRELLFHIPHDDGPGTWVGLHAERDGSVRPLCGTELTALKGRCLAASAVIGQSRPAEPAQTPA